MNIDFFKPIELEASSSTEIDWYDFNFILKEYKNNHHYLFKIPEKLSNDIFYFKELETIIPTEKIYPYFSKSIQLDSTILKKVLSHFIDTEKIHFLPKEIRKDPFWMLIILNKKPFLYYHLESPLINSIDFHCRLLKTLLNKMLLGNVSEKILHSYDFLNTCETLLEENKIDILWLKKYLPLTWQLEILNNPFQEKQIFFNLFLKLKLEHDLIDKKIIEKKAKL